MIGVLCIGDWIARMSTSEHALAFLCAYAESGDGGLLAYQQDQSTGELTETARHSIDAASFLAIDAGARYLYSVNRIDGGVVIAHEIASETGELREINRTSSGGVGPAYVSVDPLGAYVFVANYAGGSIALYPIRDDGGLDPASHVIDHEGSSVDSDRQEGPHPHSIVPDPAGQFVYVPDLGTDDVWIYAIDRDADELTPASESRAPLASGAGPRHLDFHPTQPIMYVINELDSTISTFRRDTDTGALSHVDTCTTLPPDADGESYCADIHVHPAGEWVYGSNRGHDSIAVFTVEADGSLTSIEHTPCGGEWPRNFAIDPVGQYLYVENRHSDTIVSFAIDDETGTLEPTDAVTQVPEPICLVFVD